MKTSMKITIGLSIAAVAGVAVAVTASEKIVKKIYHVSNRCKAKKFVNDKLGGNDQLMNIVDRLSDEELDSLMGVLSKVKEGGKKVSRYGDHLKENADGLKERFMSMVDEMM